jgi:phosphate starvation-inducible PhoH-like protein
MVSVNDPEAKVTVPVEDAAILRRLCGASDANLKALADALGVRVSARGAALHLAGEAPACALAVQVVRALMAIARKKGNLHPGDVLHAVAALKEDPEADLERLFLDVVVEGRGGKKITPRGLGQKRYVDAIRKCDVTFGIGPAGTGKTYLAVAHAVQHLKAEKVARIVLTRPAVEAGERLGFLPGDLEAKVNPYVRPLYDALNDLLGVDESRDLIERQVIEVAPLAFMRGRTLNDSFIILDEAQNTTREQMKMFLTRLGFNAKMVVSGDVTQIDLPSRRASGLLHSVRILEGVKGIGVVHFTDADVVRHDLVQRMVRAFERFEDGAGADER